MEAWPMVLALLVIGVMGGVVITVWDIARRYEAHQVAYLNWFLLHFSVGGLGLLAVILLAALGRITAEGVAALLGSVVAYSLGAAAAKSSGAPARPNLSPSAGPDGSVPTPQPAVVQVQRPQVVVGVHAPTAPAPRCAAATPNGHFGPVPLLPG